MITRFMDMHSGGSQKEKFSMCYIEAPEDEARRVFFFRFGHDADRVTCTCCGGDYSVGEDTDLAQASGYDRGCYWNKDPERKGGGYYLDGPDPTRTYQKYRPLQEYLADPEVLFIPASDITPEQRTAVVKKSGFVWVDGEDE